MADMVSRIYTGFRGVDFRGDEINLARSPDALNVWKDYAETDSIRTRPGMEWKMLAEDAIYGIFFCNGYTLLHIGEALYSVAGDGAQRILSDDLEKTASNGFVFGDKLYFMNGKQYLQTDGEEAESVDGFVPTTVINCTPSGSGEPFQKVNLLTGRRKNSFVADGTSTVYQTDAYDGFDAAIPPKVTFADQEDIPFEYDYEKGTITFSTAPKKPQTEGQDNVTIEFSKTVNGNADMIRRCTILQLFDNRVFVSGNPDYPNRMWHCSLENPTYFADFDYYDEGVDTAAIRGMVAGNNALWVFREPSDANTTVFYHTPTIDEVDGKIYPSVHSSVTTGCVGRAINFNDDIVFFSDRGMEGISGDITTEQVVAHRSSLVDRKLIAEPNYKDMKLVEWNGYLIVFVDDDSKTKAYVADSRTAFQNDDHIEYEWFYWEMEHQVTCAKVHSGVLYLGTNDGLYTLTDTTGNLESYWVTPKDKFKNPHKLKTTNKRGCVAEATGDISVYTKTENTEFEQIGEYTNVSDYFVSRIKQKKFKDIQLKFHSGTRFSLEAITLEAFVGGYIKR